MEREQNHFGHRKVSHLGSLMVLTILILIVLLIIILTLVISVWELMLSSGLHFGFNTQGLSCSAPCSFVNELKPS